LTKATFTSAVVGLVFGACLSALAVPFAGAEAVGEKHTLVANGDHFELDGKRFQIISGAMHYARVPRAYWRDRFRKARAMGLNTIETYVFWNKHETAPGEFDFSGQNDIAEFVREAQEEGLFVILRPGPYVCAEWEFGGYPAWLLREPGMEVRSSNAAFMAASTRWMHRLGKELAPLQSANGGPILAVQVENEYGSYGADHAYMEQVHKLVLESGFDKAMLYTADGADEVPNGSLPELPVAINFGTGDAKSEFAKLAKLRPTGPRMCGEYWSGWFDHWSEGSKHAHTDAAAETADLKWMLQQGYSVNLYMFHGGTSFGWMNGANSNGKNYEPDVTSYAYDSPVSEDGSLGRKFAMFRDAIAEATGVKPAAPPTAIAAHALPDVPLKEAASLWENLPKPIASDETKSMEEVGQGYGYILYRTQIAKAQSGLLHIDELHSYAQVFIDGVLAGTIDRRLNQTELKIDVKQDGSRLDILVENTGRVNYGKQLPKEKAGITHQVLLNGSALKGWSIYPLPMLDVSKMSYKADGCSGDCFYKAEFDVADVADTFVETNGFGKGEVWINGEPLGRFWSVGPQRTLYLPAPWLKKGRNEIVVFDTSGAPGRMVRFVAKPNLGATD
jgi:beta-galactosidase